MDKTPQEELKSLSQAFAKINEEFKTLIAAKPKKMPTPDPDASDEMSEMKKMMHDMMNNHSDSLHNHMSNLHQNMHAAIENVHSRVDKLHQMHYEHANSSKHLPPLSPSQLNKLIKHAGAEGDVQILPKQIYSSQDYIIAEYIKPIKT